MGSRSSSVSGQGEGSVVSALKRELREERGEKDRLARELKASERKREELTREVERLRERLANATAQRDRGDGPRGGSRGGAPFTTSSSFSTTEKRKTTTEDITESSRRRYPLPRRRNVRDEVSGMDSVSRGRGSVSAGERGVSVEGRREGGKETESEVTVEVRERWSSTADGGKRRDREDEEEEQGVERLRQQLREAENALYRSRFSNTKMGRAGRGEAYGPPSTVTRTTSTGGPSGAKNETEVYYHYHRSRSAQDEEERRAREEDASPLHDKYTPTHTGNDLAPSGTAMESHRTRSGRRSSQELMQGAFPGAGQSAPAMRGGKWYDSLAAQNLALAIRLADAEGVIQDLRNSIQYPEHDLV